MKVLVTGGAGFIGSNICAALLEHGADVTVLDNFSSGWRANLERLSGIRVERGDVRDTEAVTKAMDGCDTVFHLAASVGNKRSIDHPHVDTAINVQGTLNILMAARDQCVEKLVVSSSAGIYGELKTLPIREDHPLAPLTPYGVSKLYTEKMSLAFARTYGMEAICLRYFNVYGPNQRFDAYGNVIPIFAFRALAGDPIVIFGDGQQTRDFVHVDDVVQANIKAATNRGVSGAFNIASATQVTIRDLAHAVNSHVDRPVAIEHAGVRRGDVAHSRADITSAQQAFGYVPETELTPGLAGYMAWAREEADRAANATMSEKDLQTAEPWHAE
ncbi:NAD-dependent epimerase/dehydratase family protein [Maritimibacter dapengensis]|uniref:NAD-dependent epimerase/dehydratase family protein n=1 Tax=Maritimibacter dapengensis TaxID=2836868 RepID=A0ABS6T079_9RHOB|nr:NAD-dependent epimerase/dehydratase family protein [Maritimibacter dapengensis]MBV7377951.1 NAD-dependent epimerase/dehydratase family protein [Maritimibacter dapengensis]